MILKLSLLVIFAVISICEGAFVETLQKCSLKDGECLKHLVKNILNKISNEGIKEYDIPPIDPLELKNVNVTVLNLMDLALDDLTLKGFKDCEILRADVSAEKGKAVFELNCDVVIKGKHKVTGSSPIIKNLFGSDSVTSDGSFKLKLGKLHLTFKFYFDVIKKDDGETYFNCKPDEFRYKYDIGSFHITADKVFIGKNDASKDVVAFVNQNYKLLIDAVGDRFFEVAIKIFIDYLHRFFNKAPNKYYITEDLTPFIKTNS